MIKESYPEHCWSLSATPCFIFTQVHTFPPWVYLAPVCVSNVIITHEWHKLGLGNAHHKHRVCSNTHTTILFHMAEKEMQYARNTRMLYCIWSHFAVFKPACFSGYSDTQSSVLWKISHTDWADRAQADDSSLTDDRSKRVKVQGVVCPNCMHTACNSTYFVRAAAALYVLKVKRQSMWFGTQPQTFSSCDGSALLRTLWHNYLFRTDNIEDTFSQPVWVSRSLTITSLPLTAKIHHSF